MAKERTEPHRNEELIAYELRDTTLDPKEPDEQTEPESWKHPDDHTRQPRQNNQ